MKAIWGIDYCDRCEGECYDPEHFESETDPLCRQCRGYGLVPYKLQGFDFFMVEEFKPLYRLKRHAMWYIYNNPLG